MNERLGLQVCYCFLMCSCEWIRLWYSNFNK